MKLLLQYNFATVNDWFFFFFYWRYNPLWVLAFSVISFHCTLSSHCFLHRLTPIICKSSSMSAIHLFRGLPLVLVPIGFHCNILLGVLLSSIRITWPSEAIPLLFINLIISAYQSAYFFLICGNCYLRLLGQAFQGQLDPEPFETSETTRPATRRHTP